MAQPVWITPAGSLGIIPEGVFYQIPLQAYEPSAQTVRYRVIAGELPAGVQCAENGLITGVPLAIASLQGVPQEVNRDVVSKFAIRAYTVKTVNGQTVIDRLADRTFTLTVTGPDAPEFVTPPGTIASYYDGSVLPGLQIEYTDPDPDETVVVRLVAGTLPPGTTLSPTGLISGFIDVNAEIDATAGYSRDGQGYEEYPYDFSTQSADTTYEFTLEVTDGSLNNLRTFNIIVYSRNNLTADNTNLTADNDFVTADVTPVRTPIITTPQGLIDTVRSDNFFAYQFVGLDLDGDQIAYVMTGSVPGLMLDTGSGWLYGYIPDLGLTELVYDFSIQVYKVNDPSYISDAYLYSLAINGPIDSDITWITPADLGTIVNGATSTLRVEAVSRAGLELNYRLLSGSRSLLPQGLRLLPSGNIVGRVSFDTFALDGGTTTFDIDSRNRTPAPTTFDLKFTFVVQFYSVNSVVNITKTFSVTIVREYNEPYENLYVQAMPPLNDRAVLEDLLQDPQIFPPELIYRSDDPNFGVSTRVVYRHAFGLTASTLEDYYSSLYENHYWKNLVLGEIEVAVARNSNNEIIYEVVYSRVIDNLLNDAGQSVSKQVTLPYAVETDGGQEIDVVYPNSLINMRDQVIDTVGQIGNVLPTWMISKQRNGRVLGFTPAWVIAYVKPGQGARVAYNISTIYGDKLNLIDFKVDRYELDGALTSNWDPVTGQWVPSPPTSTTFDINCHYQLPEPNDSSFVFVGGSGYAVGNQIRILGSQLGGVDGPYNPALNQFGNDVVVTVEVVDGSGTITQARASGTAPLFSAGQTYINIAGTNITGTGTGATWDLEVVPGSPTIFDGNSLQFIAPVDIYTDTQAYDKYLVFPYRNIINPEIIGPPLAVGWTNFNGYQVNWINNFGNPVTWFKNG
jgi:hypothetical protein